MNTEESRNEFERWFKKDFHYEKSGPYVKNMLLEAWQAAKAQTVSQWIPVSERLPDAGVLCIVFGANGVVNNQFEYYKQGHIKGYFGSVVDGCVFELTEVTHWVPLPAAPVKDGE